MFVFYSMVYSSSPFVCYYTVLCVSVRLSVYHFEYCLPICASVHVFVRPPVCIFLCDIVCHSVGLYVFFPFVRLSDHSPILSSSVSMNACKSAVYVLVCDISFSKFLLLTSYF